MPAERPKGSDISIFKWTLNVWNFVMLYLFMDYAFVIEEMGELYV